MTLLCGIGLNNFSGVTAGIQSKTEQNPSMPTVAGACFLESNFGTKGKLVFARECL
jgi:hypothetical protein